MYNQQTHIAMHEKLTCYIGIYVGAQRPHNQKYEEVDLGHFRQLSHQSRLEEVFGNQVR